MTLRSYFALMMCASYPAMADPQVSLHMFDEKRADSAVGEIHHNNQLGNPGIRTFYLETPYGEIKLRIDVTLNAYCDPECPDTLEVLSLPVRLVAIPSIITTAEGETGVIVLYEWEGM